MKDKEFRELQLSSTHLVLIFLSLIVVGVVVFLLGVSVGKKQAQMAKQSDASAAELTAQIKESPVSAPVEKKEEPCLEK